MSLRKTSLFAGLLGLVYLGTSMAAQARDLTISSFNIRFYGAQEQAGDETDRRTRDRWINKYMAEEIPDSDVIVFQEIIDPDRFAKKVARSKYKCTTYPHESSRHLHVMLCHTSSYRFVKAPFDRNYIIESVALNRYRPALHGVIKSSRGKSLLYIVGVHLKAQEDSTYKRIQQIRNISRYVSANEPDIPIVMVGDFNTHGNDVSTFNGIFEKYDLPVYHVRNPFRYTYRTRDNQHKLDHFWIDRSLDISYSITVSPPCASGAPAGDPLYNLDKFNLHVSDHCPVTLTVDTP